MQYDPDLKAAATAARAFMAPVWHAWNANLGIVSDLPSRGTCGRTSLFLQRVLREDFAITSQWCSGAPHLGDTGFHDGWGWQGHAWIKAGDFIIDITADQFGADPIVVTSCDDARYRDAGQDSAMPCYQALRIQMVNDVWSDWLTSAARATILQPRATRTRSRKTGTQSPSPLVS